MRGSFPASPWILTLALGWSFVTAVRSWFHTSRETRSGPGVEHDQDSKAAPAEPAAARLQYN